MAESDSTTSKGKCPKAKVEGGRFCKVCFLDVVQEDVKQLNRLGDCLQTLAHTQELQEEKTLEVTTEQLRSWAFLCHHIALWLPEHLHEAAVGQEAEVQEQEEKGRGTPSPASPKLVHVMPNEGDSSAITYQQLEDIETCLRKVRAIGDWMSFIDQNSGFGFPEESLRETGDMLKELAEGALKVMLPGSAKEAPAGGE